MKRPTMLHVSLFVTVSCICFFSSLQVVNLSVNGSATEKIEGIAVDRLPPLPFAGLPNYDENHTVVHAYDLFDQSPNHTDCKKFADAYFFDDGSLKKVPALVSYPGSGNTWLRVIFGALTGMYIDAVYPERIDLANGSNSVMIPQDCGCTLMKKTHDFSLNRILHLKIRTSSSRDFLYDGIRQCDGDGILLIRNPFKAIISYRNFAFGYMSGMAPASAFSQEHRLNIPPRPAQNWDNWVASAIVSWETLAIIWIRNLKRGGVIYYEKLRDNTESELRRMLKLLSFPHVDEERLQCVLRHKNDNSLKRKDTGRNHKKNPFNKSQTLLILQSIQRVQLALKERNLDPLPVEQYEIYTSVREFGRYEYD